MLLSPADKLSEGCSACDGDLARCSKAERGWSLDAAGKPFRCDLPDCATCASPKQCAACSSGYGLDKGGKCVEVRWHRL